MIQPRIHWSGASSSHTFRALLTFDIYVYRDRLASFQRRRGRGTAQQEGEWCATNRRSFCPGRADNGNPHPVESPYGRHGLMAGNQCKCSASITIARVPQQKSFYVFM